MTSGPNVTITACGIYLEAVDPDPRTVAALAELVAAIGSALVEDSRITRALTESTDVASETEPTSAADVREGAACHRCGSTLFIAWREDPSMPECAGCGHVCAHDRAEGRELANGSGRKSPGVQITRHASTPSPGTPDREESRTTDHGSANGRAPRGPEPHREPVPAEEDTPALDGDPQPAPGAEGVAPAVRECSECGTVFVPKRRDSRHCSKSCSKRAGNRNYQARHREQEQERGRRRRAAVEESPPSEPPAPEIAAGGAACREEAVHVAVEPSPSTHVPSTPPAAPPIETPTEEPRNEAHVTEGSSGTPAAPGPAARAARGSSRGLSDAPPENGNGDAAGNVPAPSSAVDEIASRKPGKRREFSADETRRIIAIARIQGTAATARAFSVPEAEIKRVLANRPKPEPSGMRFANSRHGEATVSILAQADAEGGQHVPGAGHVQRQSVVSGTRL